MVVIVSQFPIPEGKSGQEIVDRLIKQFESMQFQRVGNFVVDCETYYSAPIINPPRVLNIIHNSEYPATCFAQLDTGTILRADSYFDAMMVVMNGVYQAKRGNKIECKGPKFQKGDFIVRIGSVSIGPSFRGILVEIEYGPCSVPIYCWDLLKEFIKTFMRVPKEPPPYYKNRMTDVCTPVDTISQYNIHFTNYRKMTLISSCPPPNPSAPKGPNNNDGNSGDQNKSQPGDGSTSEIIIANV
ncbi:mediator of RNA polymerase II transcription subunit 20-like [Panonychus citri]|uniref:mediator of RNA polymerase II transcription subunit 20-like n=1 Tax=Panonychus citri TaxID=50023 RepID=UPI0023072945|nr:mediator of RNA polymerase II transcription subunit 20-like [Panonychus citri]XP_053204017.1 mediator of RNA polymerase II transcription subunit 20-like [Panonychus citri]